MEEIGTLTAILQNFSSIFQGGVKNITPYALGLFSSLLIIDFTWTTIRYMMNEENIMPIMVKRFLKYGIFLWIIKNYSDHVNKILQTFLKVGVVAGGNKLDTAVLTDPSYIIDMGLKMVWPIISSSGLVGILPVGSLKLLILLIAAFFSLLSYFIIALCVFTTYLEFYVIGALAIIFLPFALVEKTAFLAEKGIAAIIAISVKIMVTAFVLSATLPFLEELNLGADWLWGADFDNAVKFMFAVMAIAFLSFHIPSMAVGLFAGQPSLSGGSFLGAGLMAAATITTVLKQGFQGLQETIRAMDGLGGATGISNVEKVANLTGIGDMIYNPSIPEEKNTAPAGGMTAEGVATRMDSTSSSTNTATETGTERRAIESNSSNEKAVPAGGMTVESIAARMEHGTSY